MDHVTYSTAVNYVVSFLFVNSFYKRKYCVLLYLLLMFLGHCFMSDKMRLFSDNIC